MTTIHIDGLNANLTYQSSAIFELASKGAIEPEKAAEAIKMVNKLRQLNREVEKVLGTTIKAHEIKAQVPVETTSALYELIEY